MAKAKQSVALVTKSIYDLLEPFDAGERGRILNSVIGPFRRGSLRAAAVVLAVAVAVPVLAAAVAPDADLVRRRRSGPISTTRTRRIRTRNLPRRQGISNTPRVPFFALKADFQRVISTEARRSFHDGNFGRDIDNARAAKFFNPGGSAATGFTLSHVGQNYVDALPDREKAKAVKKAAKSGKKRKATKREGRRKELSGPSEDVSSGISGSTITVERNLARVLLTRRWEAAPGEFSHSNE